MQFELPDMPVTEILPELAKTLENHDRVVLQAPTGAGKTTLVPLYLLQNKHLLQNTSLPGKILMLEPRRLAASAAATRMASLLGEPVGKTVGYRMQLESRVSKETRIEVVTEGILTRMLQDDPELPGVSFLIFDEFHERSLQADLGLALTLQCQEYLREDPLKLLIMSATLQAEELSQALDAPVVTSKGFLYPVDVVYRNRPLTDRTFFNLCKEISSTIRQAITEQSGSALVFLPGAGEIRQVTNLLSEGALPENTEVHALFGEMTLEKQRQAIQACKPGHRKIVLATNIAETSLTIEGIRIVIDSGLARRAIYDPGTGMTRLETRRVSRSSADQRKGRAGRLESGVCYRLWTESENERLEASDTAEIAEADLAPLALDLCSWGATPEELFWLTPPNSRRYQEAIELLEGLQAIEPPQAITPHGSRMASLGTHPRIAHMLLHAAKTGNLTAGCRLAAILSERDLLRGNQYHSADLTHRLSAFEQGSNISVDKAAWKRVQRLTSQWHKRLQKLIPQELEADDLSAYSRLLLSAYPDRVAQRRGNSSTYLLSSGQGVELQSDDPLVGSEYLVVPSLGGDSSRRNAKVFLACAIDKASIYEELADQIEESESIRWDRKTERVLAARQDKLGALILEQQNIEKPDSEQILLALLDGVKQAGLNILPWDKDSQQLRERIQFLTQFNEFASSPFPDMSDAGLLGNLEDWLGPYLTGMTRLDQLNRLNLKEVITGMLDWPLQQTLDNEAPARWQAPSGSNIRIDYSKPEEPKVSLRLQELFGLMETPRIAFQQQPLTIEMLSPAQRPVQITRDLSNFWKSTYQEVKKDLKGRYPKHCWPDDPYTAEATRFVKPRK